MPIRRRLILASGSQPRRRLLQAAGFDPEMIPSNVQEDGVNGLSPEKAAVTLAERKALAIAAKLNPTLELAPDDRAPDRASGAGSDDYEAVVIGCDTVLLMDGVVYGKPESLDQAREWCRMQRGTTVNVVTGHCVIDLSSGHHASGASWTDVEVGDFSDGEIEAYLATGEALNAAGALTIDGYGAPFIAGLRGDHGTVVGLSLPMVRRLLAELGIPITALWTRLEGR